MSDLWYQYLLWHSMVDPVDMLAVAFYLTQIGDFVTTYSALKMGGSEGNPVVRKLMDTIGVVPTMLLFKMLSVALVYYGAHIMGADILMLIVVFYVGVIVWNVAQINKLLQRGKASVL